MTNNLGLWLSSFQADVAANLPTLYPGEGNFAMFLATDTGTLYVSPAPATAGGNASWTGVGGGTYVAVPDATPYAVTANNNGRTFVMPNLTADTTINLPLPTLGLSFSFIYGGVASDAQSWIFKTPAAANFFLGGLLHCDTNAGAGSDELVPVYPNGTSNAKLTVAVPGCGTRIRFIADGTHWIVEGLDAADTAPVFADLP